METIKKIFSDDCIVIGLCQLKSAENLKKKFFKSNSFEEREYYLNKLFAKSYAENVLLS